MPIDIGQLVATARVDLGPYIEAYAQMRAIRDEFNRGSAVGGGDAGNTNNIKNQISALEGLNGANQTSTKFTAEQTAAMKNQGATAGEVAAALGGVGGASSAAGKAAEEASIHFSSLRTKVNEAGLAIRTATQELANGKTQITSTVSGYDELEAATTRTAKAVGRDLAEAQSIAAAALPELTEGLKAQTVAQEAATAAKEKAAAKAAAPGLSEAEIAKVDRLVAAEQKAANENAIWQVVTGKLTLEQAALGNAVTMSSDEIENYVARSIGIEAANNRAASSFGRVTGSMNQSGDANFRLVGPAGLAAAAIALVGAAALKEAADLETSQVRIQSFGGVSQQAVEGLNSSFGLGATSSAAFASALAPVSGMLSTIAGTGTTSAAAMETLRAAQVASVSTGESLASAERAIVETLRNYKLSASDAQTVTGDLIDSSLKLGQTLPSVAQAYGLLHEELGSLKPTVADTKALIDAIGTSGADTSRTISALAAGFTAMYAPTQSIYDALVKYDVKTVDSAKHALPFATVLKELRDRFGDLGDQQEIAALKALGFGKDAEVINEILATQKKQLQDGTGAVASYATAQAAAQREMQTLGGVFDTLKAKVGDALLYLGTSLYGDFFLVKGAVHDLAGEIENLANSGLVHLLEKIRDLDDQGLNNLASKIPVVKGALADLHGLLLTIADTGFGHLVKAVADFITNGLEFLGNKLQGFMHLGAVQDFIKLLAIAGNPAAAAIGGTLGAGHAAGEAAAFGGNAVSPLPGNIALSGGNITQAFHATGQAGEPLVNGVPTHMGVDIATANIANTPVYASLAGTIKEIDASQGKIVETLANGERLIYQHLAPLEVKIGDVVTAGQEIGKVGAGIVGTSTGSHLHFEVQSATGVAEDPLAWLSAHAGAAGAGAGAGAGGGTVGGVPVSWLAALYEDETKGFPLPSAATPAPGFGLAALPGQGAEHYGSDANSRGGAPIDSGLFTDTNEMIKEAIASIKANVPNWEELVKSGDPRKFFSAIGASPYAGIPDEGMQEQFVENTLSLIGKPSQITGPLSALAAGGGEVPTDAGYGANPGDTPEARAAAEKSLQEEKERFLKTSLSVDQELAKSSRTVTEQTVVDDQIRIDSLNSIVLAQKEVVAAALEQQSNEPDPTKATKIGSDVVAPAQQKYQDDLEQQRQAVSQLATDQNTLTASTKTMSNAWETYGQTRLKISDQIEKQDQVVTAETIANDAADIEAARNKANTDGQILFEMLTQEQALREAGQIQEADAESAKAAAQQKVYTDDATNLGLALSNKASHQSAFDAQQAASAQATRQFNTDTAEQSQQLLSSMQNIGLQIPESWKTGLSQTQAAVQSAYSQILVLDQVLQGAMTVEDRKAFDDKRTLLEGELADAKAANSQMEAAAKQLSTGNEEAAKAAFAEAKAARALDLTDVKEKNAEKLASDLTVIQQSEQSQVASLTTSAQVATIQAGMYGQQAAAATDAASKQKAILSQQLAQQTAAIDSEEAKQISAIRDAEQQKLKTYNDTLLQYQEAQQTSAGTQLKIQADMDTAKANIDIALAYLQMDLIQMVANKQTGADNTDLQNHIKTMTDYIANMQGWRTNLLQSANDWETYGTSLTSGATKAQNAITNLATTSGNAISKLQSDSQNRLSILGAQNQAASSSISTSSAATKTDPQVTALQGQIDQLTIIKDQVNLTLVDQQNQVKALDAQNAVLNDQLTLLKDQQAASESMLSLTTQQETLAVQLDQAHLDLLNSVSDAQQTQLAAVKEQLSVLSSQNAVIDAQATLQADQAAASTSALDTQTQLKELAVEKDRATLALLNSQTQSEQDILAIEKERLAQLSSVNDVTKDQLTLLQDQFAASSAYTALTTQLKVISLEQAQVQLEVLQQTNVAAQAQLDIQNNALNVEQGKLALLEAQLKLSQDQTLASPQYLALGAQLNQLKVVQDSLSIAGLKNNALDREVTFLENQQKLLVTQNTERNTSLQQQKDIQQVAVDQLTLATQQTQQQITQVGQLQAQLLVLGNQADQLRQQQTILTDINAIQLDSLTQAEAGAKVLEDQLTLQIAQNSVITSHQAMLTLQVQYLDRQNAQLTAQQSVTTSINALALDNLTRQQATAKVQTDQLTLQQAQLNVITEATAKITLEIAAYEKESAQLDAQKKLLTDQNTLAQDSLVKQQATQKVVSDTLAIQVAQVQAQQAEANGVDATLTKLNAELQLRQAIVKVQTTAAVQQQQQQPTTQGTFGPSSQVLNPPSQPPTQGPALIPSTTYSPYGPLITGGQYAGFTIIHQVNVNIGGRTVTQLVLEDMHTGQTLDVNIP